MTIPPPVLLALVLVVAGALVLLAMLVGVVSVDEDVYFDTDAFNRIQIGTAPLDLPLLLLVPLALLLLVRTGDADDDVTGRARRAATAGVAAVAGAFCFVALVRLVANLAGDSFYSGASSTVAAVIVDLALLLVAVGGTFWAIRAFQQLSRPQSSPDA